MVTPFGKVDPGIKLLVKEAMPQLSDAAGAIQETGLEQVTTLEGHPVITGG